MGGYPFKLEMKFKLKLEDLLHSETIKYLFYVLLNVNKIFAFIF